MDEVGWLQPVPLEQAALQLCALLAVADHDGQRGRRVAPPGALERRDAGRRVGPRRDREDDERVLVRRRRRRAQQLAEAARGGRLAGEDGDVPALLVLVRGHAHGVRAGLDGPHARCQEAEDAQLAGDG